MWISKRLPRCVLSVALWSTSKEIGSIWPSCSTWAKLRSKRRCPNRPWNPRDRNTLAGWWVYKYIYIYIPVNCATSSGVYIYIYVVVEASWLIVSVQCCWQTLSDLLEMWRYKGHSRCKYVLRELEPGCALAECFVACMDGSPILCGPSNWSIQSPWESFLVFSMFIWLYYI